MIYGTDDNLQVASNPSGAKATASNGMTCTTPCSLKLPRDTGVTVMLSRDGCDNQTVAVVPVYSTKSQLVGGAGNLVTTLGLGGLVDAGTGANYNLQPNPVVVSLNCKSSN